MLALVRNTAASGRGLAEGDLMDVRVFPSPRELGQAAAERAAAAIREATAERGRARVIAATGASQFEFLDALTATPGVDWSRVEFFHLDEYVGAARHASRELPPLPEASGSSSACSRRRSTSLAGDAPDPAAGVPAGRRALLARRPIDVAFVGIGENGHLAFNDPPADFETEEPYLVVELDEACRRQQLGEGWFATARRRAAPRDLDVDPPDPEGARDPVHRPGRAQGAGRPRLPAGAR